MRTIKFRGKRIDNGEWIYGNLFIPNKFVKGVYICPDTTFADFMPDFSDGDKIEDHAGSGISLGHFHEVIPESVGQFTGLLDRFGKEIYDGDIVKYYGDHGAEGVDSSFETTHAVYYDNRLGAFEPFSDMSFQIVDNTSWEIIGNTTDTPELLTI